jgi:phosphoribosyl 1,2-cyclic phosphodiesterase
LGRNIRRADALILSHNHIDHVRGAGILHRKFGLPIHATQATFDRSRGVIGKVTAPRFFKSGASLTFGRVTVETYKTPHDGYDCVMFIVDDGVRRLGIFSDLGHPFRQLTEVIGTVDACYLESNYDDHMLETGSYPDDLKRRIRGKGGHISNVEAAELVRDSANGRLRLLVLAHLSEQNNDPAVALQTHRRVLGDGRVPDHDCRIEVASRYGATEMFEV